MRITDTSLNIKFVLESTKENTASFRYDLLPAVYFPQPTLSDILRHHGSPHNCFYLSFSQTITDPLFVRLKPLKGAEKSRGSGALNGTPRSKHAGDRVEVKESGEEGADKGGEKSECVPIVSIDIRDLSGRGFSSVERQEVWLKSISALDLPKISCVRVRLPFSFDADGKELANAEMLPPPFVIRNLLLYRPISNGQPLSLPLRNGKVCDMFDVAEICIDEENVHMRGATHGLVTAETRLDIVEHTWEPPREACTHRLKETTTQLRESFGESGERLSQVFSSAFTEDRDLHALDHQKVNSPKTVILSGPSGIGKSYALGRLADAHGAKLIVINAGTLASEYEGDLVKGFRETFAAAKKQPAALVLDHADTMFPIRGDNLALEFELQAALEWKHLREKKLAMIFVTEKRENLSEWISRLIPDWISFEIPTPVQRRCILENRLCSVDYDADQLNISELSHLCHGYIAADIEKLCRTAKEISEDQNRKDVVMQDFMSAFPHVRASVLGESVASATNVAKVRWSDVGGLHEVKAKLEESVIWLYKHAAAFRRLRIKPSKGVLLYGPPGTGKTLLAKAVSTESSANFMPVSIPDLIKGEVGESEKAIAAIFKAASRCSPCIIFLDELEAMFGSRESSSGYGKKLISQLLLEMDQLDSEEHHGVVVLAATNYPEVIDKSILRPGRLDRLIYVPPPTLTERREILSILTARMPLCDDVSLENVAEMTPYYTGADLRAVARYAGLETLKRQRKAADGEKFNISMTDFRNAVGSVSPSMNAEKERRYLDSGFPT